MHPETFRDGHSQITVYQRSTDLEPLLECRVSDATILQSLRRGVQITIRSKTCAPWSNTPRRGECKNRLMNSIGRTLARLCRRRVSRACIRCHAWFGFRCSLVSAKCIGPLQGKNRRLPGLLISRFATEPDDKLASARGTAKGYPRPATAWNVKLLLKPPATRAAGKNHREELQSSVERVDQGKVQAKPGQWPGNETKGSG